MVLLKLGFIIVIQIPMACGFLSDFCQGMGNSPCEKPKNNEKQGNNNETNYEKEKQKIAMESKREREKLKQEVEKNILDILDIIERKLSFLPGKSVITPEFCLAMIQTESGYNKKARSSKGAIGLCQIMPNTFIEIAKYNAKMRKKYPQSAELFISFGKKTDKNNPDVQISSMISYCYMIEQMVNERLPYIQDPEFKKLVIAAAYNKGPNGTINFLVKNKPKSIEEFKTIIKPKETKSHIAKVEKNMKLFENIA